jgi:hypothetical protein
MSANTFNKLLLSCAVALGALAFSQPSVAQSGSRDQVRAIEQEYSRQTNGRSISDDQLEYYLDRANAGWPMSRISQDMADTRRMAPNNPWRAQQGWAPTAVVCSSIDNRYRECAVPFRGRAVVNQQISHAACIEGQSWGQKQGMVWVNRGCRARFTMVPDAVGNAPGNRPSVVCKSQQGARVVCNTGMNGRMQLISRFKNSGACVEGRTWGQRGNQVWVSDNCRARFALAPNAVGNAPGTRPSVVCKSQDGERTVCNTGMNGRMQLISRFTNSGACIEGRTWGQRANQVWVSDNCRARFAAANNQRPNDGVGYDSRDERRDDGRWMRDPGYSVSCASSDSRQQRCNWDARYGSPRLVQRTSQADCIEGRTWGYSERDGLWVSGGCRARFAAR